MAHRQCHPPELAAVPNVDGRVIGEGEVGPLTRRLGELFGALTKREGTPVM